MSTNQPPSGTTFNSIKQKFNVIIKNKAFRIICAIVIISGIMVGVAFGIMAFVNSITNKCANQPGTKWNKEFNKCMAPCNNICLNDTKMHKKGDCLPDNYCSNNDGTPIKTKYGEGVYIYDSESCACKGSCPDNKIARTETGEETTDGYKSDNQLICAIPCKYKKSGIADPLLNNTCGVHIEQSVSTINKNPIQGQFDSYTINNPSNYSRCEKSDVYCKKNKEICKTIPEGPAWVNIEQVNKKFHFSSYCEPLPTTCSSPAEIICTNDGHCGQYGTCSFSDKQLTDKGIYNLGVCSGAEQIDKEILPYGSMREAQCSELKYVGERVSNYDNICELYHNASCPEGNCVGISLRQPQCVTEASCNIKNLDDPKWFCKSNNEICGYIDQNGFYNSCTEDPPVSSREDNNSLTPICCTHPYLYGNTALCCPDKLVDVNGSKSCFNSSLYKPNPNWVSGVENISCSTKEDCYGSKYENLHSLHKKLSNYNMASNDYSCISDVEKVQNSYPEKNTYADFYCDNGECKFIAGYIYNSVAEFEPLWNVNNDHKNSNSEALCQCDDSGACGNWGATEYPINNSQKLSLCKWYDGSSFPNEKRSLFGLYNYDGSKKNDSHEEDSYYTNFIINWANKKELPPDMENMCNARVAIEQPGFTFETVVSDKECSSTFKCASGNKHINIEDELDLNWNFSPEDLKGESLPGTLLFATVPNVIQTYFQSIDEDTLKKVPRLKNFKDDSMWSAQEKNLKKGFYDPSTPSGEDIHGTLRCDSLSAVKSDDIITQEKLKKLCIDPYIPPGWSGLEDNLYNLCSWDNVHNLCIPNTSSPFPNYIITGQGAGSYCGRYNNSSDDYITGKIVNSPNVSNINNTQYLDIGANCVDQETKPGLLYPIK